VTGLLLPRTAIDAIVEDIAAHGREGVESGCFLLSRNAAPHNTDAVALLGDKGIQRSMDRLAISGRALAVLFDWAESHDRRVTAQIHSHTYDAFLSDTDRRFSLTVEGFTVAVVGDAAHATRDPALWSWWRFEAGEWVPVSPARQGEAAVTIVRLDEDGVHG
jgi:hypothetical protein